MRRLFCFLWYSATACIRLIMYAWIFTFIHIYTPFPTFYFCLPFIPSPLTNGRFCLPMLTQFIIKKEKGPSLPMGEDSHASPCFGEGGLCLTVVKCFVVCYTWNQRKLPSTKGTPLK
ncbi:hypothetical protein, unlikely [Trypanosoma brucei gambiense DAL972]|uniref:Uncharacterized protein n=1 Tax=Trypanosoma brucei gambiense (strain MHOM/CI/86/DAL972) TaxID=679716 RepID=C9ZRT9_TRYB9|nr:hypothetical protein, unlikely [Trypanosoma brucei gambiense DAL972]CBH12075.1 hypothetical protein, unlikely [Trypanosoma brucei gambiense DAL972]|eukprot:XP_011774358.1 hypothetical protein, unlikely [Trypanosoma brucei gambiense DAL972]